MAFHNSKYLESVKQKTSRTQSRCLSPLDESTPMRRYAVPMQPTGLFDRQGDPCYDGNVQSWYVIYMLKDSIEGKVRVLVKHGSYEAQLRLV